MLITTPFLQCGGYQGVLCSQKKELEEGQSEFREPQEQSWAEPINASQRDTQSFKALPPRHEQQRPPCPSAAEKHRYNPVLCPGRQKLQVGANRTAGHEISRPVLDSCSQKHRKRQANGQRNLMRKQWSLVILRQRAVYNRWKRERMRKIKDICPFQLWQGHEMNVSDH